MSGVDLSPKSIDAIARRVVELLHEHGPASASTARLLTASEVAARCGLSREWVYDHADQLGAIRLGEAGIDPSTGKPRRPRLRFDLERVEQGLATTGQKVPPSRARPVRRAAATPGAPLLRIAGTENRSA